MAGTSYIPGSWFGVVRSGTAVLLGPDTPPALAGALWDLLADGPEVHEVLHAVTSSSGGSLASIPSFGILDFNGSLRVFLRGGLDLTVSQPQGPVELDGRDVTTWTERRFALPGPCTLTIPGAGAAGLPELPLREGVVLLQSLSLGLGADQPALATGTSATALVVDPDGNADVRQTIKDVPAPAAAEPVVEEPADSEPVAAEPVVTDEPAPAAVDPEQADPEPADTGSINPEPINLGRVDPGSINLDPVNLDPVSLDRVDPDPIDPDVTILPDQGVSSETVLGVIDDESDPLEGPDSGQEPAGMPASAPATDHTSSYDHLWERTVMRNIEDAAVREDPEEEHAGNGPALAPALGPVAGRPSLETAGIGPAEPAPPPPAPGPPAPVPPVPVIPVQVPPVPVHPVPGGVLIDSVPWRTPDAGSAVAPAPVFGAVPPSSAPGPAGDAPEAAGAGFDGDHDGQTVMKSSLAGTAARPAPAMPVEDAEGKEPDGPMVLARVCGHGHANPPTRAQCSACGAVLLPDAVQVARPRLGRVRMSTGELLDLDQSLVIGRQPSVSRVQGGVMPRLVQVASPGGDISRSHVEVRLEGWHVMLCDLKATNGTVLVREGQPPRRLAQNEMAILLDGDIAELGDNISLRFEEIP
ncbi:FHA domain-containing protein [Arthrobacter nitrophenolicus]|uniref:FHA domain-containing protein n=1 Tax=Arthrobacter nitrophenolicus TaxID=683150 RepID=UPI00389A4C82